MQGPSSFFEQPYFVTGDERLPHRGERDWQQPDLCSWPAGGRKDRTGKTREQYPPQFFFSAHAPEKFILIEYSCGLAVQYGTY